MRRPLRTPTRRAVPDISPSRHRRACFDAAAAPPDAAAARRGRSAAARRSAGRGLKPAPDRAGEPADRLRRSRPATRKLKARRAAERPPPAPAKKSSPATNVIPAASASPSSARAFTPCGSSSQRKYPPSGRVQDASGSSRSSAESSASRRSRRSSQMRATFGVEEPAAEKLEDDRLCGKSRGEIRADGSFLQLDRRALVAATR